MFKVGDRVVYIDDGEFGIVIGLETSSGVPDYHIEWSSGMRGKKGQHSPRRCRDRERVWRNE